MTPDRSHQIQPPVVEPVVVVTRRQADATRRTRLVHLLAVLLDKPGTPDNRREQ